MVTRRDSLKKATFAGVGMSMIPVLRRWSHKKIVAFFSISLFILYFCAFNFSINMLVFKGK
jgi:hypothetical protein